MGVPANIVGIMNKIYFDSDALAYLSSANITNIAQRKALNTLVISLKASGVWAKCTAIYPIMGLTSASQGWNLRNLTQFNIIWVNAGSGFFEAAGFFGNQVAYGRTGINPLSNLSQNNNHLMFYSGTDVQNSSVIELGASSGSGSTGTQIYVPRPRTTANLLFNNNNLATNDSDSVANTNSRGFYLTQRTSSTSSAAIKNGVTILTSAKVSKTPANFELYLGGSNANGIFAGGTTRYISFASAGQSFTTQEITDYYNAVQSFQTALSRNF